ncbi:metal ABC transporter ATP-binding protein [Acetobacter sp. UBA5411]|uniref:metal ABC transporter ATP-binding protein n=1 Tax=Acetobacter sp. UBA5411 TaxID=1945905 RepID=UPI0025C2A652|nr:ABC transporter ATP-binding protein [Acetobacter sp. UBA5411]
MVAASGLYDHTLCCAVGPDCLGCHPAMTLGAIRLQDAGVCLNGTPVWQHVTGSFPPGSMTAIAGANGSGKSTLLRAILGELPLSEGQVLFDGVGIRDIGYLPQARNIDRSFPLSVTDMVLSGAWQQTGAFGGVDQTVRVRAAEALRRVKLEGQADRMIDALSVGQFQRLLFARLLMTSAPIIMLDEPFTALDAPTTEDLLELVREWHAQGRTIIVVLHDMHQIRTCCPHVVLLSGGRAIWGETASILTPGTLQRAYDSPQGSWTTAQP